ncbi:efflux RND transporter permease subunit [Granulicella mallensis]|uniref:Acriflavin resistance protein n=1 Tax=Granulicella mallensis (strain ATCC BAA-1857 / DSM 23137 / MP5ACTX8) TaxID=682795 RepID=G8P0R8_GRAMM|nr:efflux RND transporter permease subunit [Granulicella mallensis]AEU34676.1 acriflavin resistance protein [Granulicella mallensis MP5ACTX8]
MWIVRLALKRPYTFVVLSLLLFIIGPVVMLRTPVDIFPNIDIPVVSVVWNYAGMSPQELSDRIVLPFERSLTTTVNDIEHSESQTLNGVSVVKIFFRPQVNISQAVAQVTAISQTALRQYPQGTTPPLVIQYSASSVPVLQLGLSGNGLTEQQLNDFGQNFVRTQLATVQGAALAFPYGGKQRQVQVDINTQKLQAYGLSASDVVNSFNAQNIILPGGDVKMGHIDYPVETNSAPTSIKDLNDLPIKTVNGATVYIRDIGNVRDGFPPQTNIVRVDGQRSSLLSIQKTGNSSTLDIIANVRAQLPSILAQLPPQLRLTPIADQSIFVRAAISGVVREALIAACLTAAMILIFLGSWRSTVIIAVSIPLSVICSLLMLAALGETINIMTLGGLALAVGILVDDATVEIENINRNLEEGKEVEDAILTGAAQIAVPAFVSTISICIVFVPMFFLTGVAKYLFVPLAEAVVFAMLASYFLSRTIVPTMAKYLLKGHEHDREEQAKKSKNPFVRFQITFEHYFEKLRQWYYGVLGFCMEYRAVFLIAIVAFWVGSITLLYPWLGQDFFPSVDGGQFKLHVRAHTGTRIEDTARLCDEIEAEIRQEIPEAEMGTVIDNIGIPYSGLNLSYSNSATVGTADADILVTLAEKHRPTDEYTHSLRDRLTKQFPGTEFYYLPTDMVSQILNFGLPAPIDIQLVGQAIDQNHALAEQMMEQISQIPGTTDLRIQQPFNLPSWTVNVDRTRAQQVGFSQHDVANDVLTSLSGSFQTSPTFYLNPQNHVSYNIAVQTPQYDVQNLQQLQNFPIATIGSNRTPQILGNIASIDRGTEQGTVSHYNARSVIDIYGSVEGTDLASVATKIDQIVKNNKGKLPRGTEVIVRGQIQTMRTSFVGLVAGLLFSIILVYALIVVNFQSWLDPFIIIAALPGALAGIVWLLFLTGTHISVPALTGAIMCVGVATANSILVVSFAKEQMEAGLNAAEAALSAGFTRFRPVIMTALAMMIGMVPMALGLGDGGEQNAPLGRAVIGGLLLATFGTLTFVPVFFSFMHRKDKPHANPPAEHGNEAHA